MYTNYSDNIVTLMYITAATSPTQVNTPHKGIIGKSNKQHTCINQHTNTIFAAVLQFSSLKASFVFIHVPNTTSLQCRK